MKVWAFISVALKRLQSRLSLTLLLIISVALIVGLMVAVPVFSGAVSMRMMREEIAFRTKTLGRPTFSLRFYSMPNVERPMGIEEAEYNRDWIADMLTRNLDLPLKMVYMQVESPMYHLRPQEGDLRYTSDYLGSVKVAYVQDIENHIEVVNGIPYGPVNTTILPVWVEEAMANELAVQVNEVYNLGDLYTKAIEPIKVQVVGFWRAKDPTEKYWYMDPTWSFDGVLVTTREHYRTFIYPRAGERSAFAFWYYIMDDAKLNLDRAPFYIANTEAIAREVERRLPNGRLDSAPLEELARGQRRKISLSIILFGFAVPLFGILIFFMVSIANMAARYQSREIAMLSSRGSSRIQILSLIFIETVIILAIGCPLGIVLGMALARFMGYSLSFMHFVFREPLEVHLASVDWRLVAAAVVVSFIARLVPSWLTTRSSIVAEERRTARTIVRLGATRLMLLAVLIATTYYAYRQLSLKGTLGLVSWQINDPNSDPLLLLAPTLFLFTVPLIAAEIFVLLMRPLTWLARALPSATSYLGLMNLGREGGQYRMPTYLLILCLSLGVFYASVAKSADAWLVDRRRYEVGADLTFKQGLPSEESLFMIGSKEEDPGAVLPISEYTKIKGVADATRVGEFDAAVPYRGVPRLRVLAIDRLDFARVAYYRRDFAAYPLGELMNRLGAQPNGVLLPRSIAAQAGVNIGDPWRMNIVIDRETTYPFEFVVVGLFDYFPTIYYEEKPGVVINASFLETETGGVAPNGIWMRLEPDADVEEIMNQVRAMQVRPGLTRDLRAILESDQQRLERVGIFGLLSICFLAGAVLSGIGLLVYNFASMVARSYRFAVLRAMGLKQREVMSMVTVEYIATLAYGIILGTILGVVASRLYVPFFPLTENPSLPVPPFIPFIDWQRAIWMALTMGVTLILIETFILLRVARARVFEALRMGTRE